MDFEKEYKSLVGRITKAHLYAQTDSTSAVLEDIYPSLAESEDERILNGLIAAIKDQISCGGEFYFGIPLKDILAYLEKHKESLHISETCKEKPNSFTDKDKKMLERVLESLVCYRSKVYDEGEGELASEIDEEIAWMQAWEEQKPLSPDEKMNHSLFLEGFDVGREVGKVEAKQKPAEWSEEDENKIKDIIDYLECWNDFDHGSESFEEYRKRMESNIQFMKSLRPSWKPSEEQMEHLQRAINYYESDWGENKLLRSLINDLKRLM